MDPRRHEQFQVFGPISYAQHGDDFALANIFRLLNIEKPSYLDVGAHHPWHISNTALLYERGSRGINVEANPVLFAAFEKERAEDVNLNVGVAATYGLRNFYLFDDTSGLNTFSDSELEMHGRQNLRGTLQLYTFTIDSIVREHAKGVYPDILLTDIEGLDYEVLESADFSASRPKVICTETRREGAPRLKEMLIARGYFCYQRVQANLIFAEERFRDLLY